VIGDGEAETGPLAASWHSNKFLDPVGDGVVLPILHLNGYKIANPAVLDRLADGELNDLLNGYGWDPYLVEGDDPLSVHQQMAATLDVVLEKIVSIQETAWKERTASTVVGAARPRWPLIVLRTPKGWTGPKFVDGKQLEGTWRSHQVPFSDVRGHPQRLAMLEEWMRAYKPEELFDSNGQPFEDMVSWLPKGTRRMGSNLHSNGGALRRPLTLPGVREFGVAVTTHGAPISEPTRVLGSWLREVFRSNEDTRNFRLFGPDETASNRLDAVYEVTNKAWEGTVVDVDEHLASQGRVMEILSEHTCQGWLEGYLLTGRHGLFSCYEAFIHLVDSMFNQHAKWLKVTSDLDWRRDVSSLNYLLTSHVWRQDHNGFSHQDPGFIDHVVNKKADVIRVYLPPDTNCLLGVMDHCLRTTNTVNVVVSGKQPTPTWLGIEEAMLHCASGIGIWEWASNDQGKPDVVLGCAGDTPTLEVLAAAAILRAELPSLKVRVVNVVDLMRLQDRLEHPHGLPARDYDSLFPPNCPLIFAYHGYPWLIHRLAYRRVNHNNLHVRGYKEEGTTTTPFDMLVLNDVDRFRLVMDVIDHVPTLGSSAAGLRQKMVDNRARHHEWIRIYGEDLPEIREWVWPV
jgi:xylulose-5-phosphate/fructose-6-phosphate phosphoketolase